MIRTTMNTVLPFVETSLPARFLSVPWNAIGAELRVAPLHSLMGLPSKWMDDEYREAAMEAEVRDLIGFQVRVNREERGLTQTQLAKLMHTKQPAISKLENPDGGDVQVATLLKVAQAFGCALLVKFVPFAEFAAHTQDVRPDRLFVQSFADYKVAAMKVSYHG